MYASALPPSFLLEFTNFTDGPVNKSFKVTTYGQQLVKSIKMNIVKKGNIPSPIPLRSFCFCFEGNY